MQEKPCIKFKKKWFVVQISVPILGTQGVPVLGTDSLPKMGTRIGSPLVGPALAALWLSSANLILGTDSVPKTGTLFVLILQFPGQLFVAFAAGLGTAAMLAFSAPECTNGQSRGGANFSKTALSLVRGDCQNNVFVGTQCAHRKQLRMFIATRNALFMNVVLICDRAHTIRSAHERLSKPRRYFLQA